MYVRNGTESSRYPIYYYRGVVTNNNVLFANFCWKIVRTTETGGIKLIYNGTPNSSSYEAEYANTNNSTIKTTIDTWYESNMTGYTSYLEDTIWCNDRSFASSNTGTGYGTSETYYGAYERVGEDYNSFYSLNKSKYPQSESEV